jgi:hypothetical protein
MKFYTEHGGIDLCILNLGINCGVWFDSRSDYIILGALNRKQEAIQRDRAVMKRKFETNLQIIETSFSFLVDPTALPPIKLLDFYS